MKAVLLLCLLGIASIALASPSGMEETQLPATTPAPTSTPRFHSAREQEIARQIKMASPCYAQAGYLDWAISDAIQPAVDNGEYEIVWVSGGITGRNIWWCPRHQKVEVAFEHYAVPDKGREGLLICDTVFFSSCGNLFATDWRPARKEHKIESRPVPPPVIIMTAAPCPRPTPLPCYTTPAAVDWCRLDITNQPAARVNPCPSPVIEEKPPCVPAAAYCKPTGLVNPGLRLPTTSVDRWGYTGAFAAWWTPKSICPPRPPVTPPSPYCPPGVSPPVSPPPGSTGR